MALPLTGITVTMVAGATGNFQSTDVGSLCTYSCKEEHRNHTTVRNKNYRTLR